jgi:hypothetical protein
VQERHKSQIGAIAADYHALGFTLFATDGTAREIEKTGTPVQLLYKLADGRRPHVLDKIKNGEIQFIINTPSESESRADEVKIRSAAVAGKIPIMTTLSGARTAVHAIRSLQTQSVEVRALQEYHPQACAGGPPAPMRAASARGDGRTAFDRPTHRRPRFSTLWLRSGGQDELDPNGFSGVS